MPSLVTPVLPPGRLGESVQPVLQLGTAVLRPWRLKHALCRMADKAGFEAEGTRRSAGLHGDGWHDMHLHGRASTAPADRS